MYNKACIILSKNNLEMKVKFKYPNTFENTKEVSCSQAYIYDTFVFVCLTSILPSFS